MTNNDSQATVNIITNKSHGMVRAGQPAATRVTTGIDPLESHSRTDRSQAGHRSSTCQEQTTSRQPTDHKQAADMPQTDHKQAADMPYTDHKQAAYRIHPGGQQTHTRLHFEPNLLLRYY